jgi:hypothetical protein
MTVSKTLGVYLMLKPSPYLTGNTLRLRYKDHRLMLFGETVDVYCENHTEQIMWESRKGFLIFETDGA